MSRAGKSYWKRHREAGLCGRCGKQPPIEGKSCCAKCYTYLQKNIHRFYEQNAAYINLKHRKCYAIRKEAGLCVVCGKAAPASGKLRCAHCAKVGNAAQNGYHARKKQKSEAEKCTSKT